MNEEQEKINAARYEWIRNQGSCPFSEADEVWGTPEKFDAAVDLAMAAAAVWQR